jgi:hypothetical protein
MRVTIKWAGVICALLIAWWGYRTFGQRVDDPTARDLFIYHVALQFKQPGLCQKIPRYALGFEGGFAPPGYTISYLQSQCYFYLAKTLPDASLCDKVRPLRRGLMDGSKFNSQYCLANAHPGQSGLAQGGMLDVPIMRKLGYLDEEMHYFQYQFLSREGNPVYNAYSRLRKDDLFADRIKAAPTFDEPLSADRIRPANELEYVYQMFAVDTNDSVFCGKISPNAQAEWPNHTTFMLRVGCYRFIALTTRDIAACEKLPTRTNLPAGVSDGESRENCTYSLGRLQPDPNNHVKYGPVSPPTFSSFQKALQELGYDVTFPELTLADYDYFLLRLMDTRQPDVAAPRAEFLRRVAAME